MMNDSTKYNRIARLIADWYDGATNREEEMEIINFFRDTDPATLPEALRQEAEVFATIGDLSAECPDKELLAEIEVEVAREQSAEKPRRRLGLRLVAVAVAASVAVLLIVGLGHDTDTQLIAEAHQDVQAEQNMTEYADNAFTPVDSVPAIDTPDETVPDSAPATRIRTPRHEKTVVPERTIADAAEPGGYIDIEDPEEAARILEEVNRHYSRALAMTTKAIIETDNALDNTREIIRSAIDNS